MKMAELEIIVPTGNDPKIIPMDARAESINLYVEAIGCPQKENAGIPCYVQYKNPAILIEALNDIGIAAVLHPEPIPLRLPERFGPHVAQIVIAQDDGDIGFKKLPEGMFEPFLPNKENPIALRIISKRGGGTGQLEYHYARRAILKTIGETYGHVLNEFIVSDNSWLTFRIRCK